MELFDAHNHLQAAPLAHHTPTIFRQLAALPLKAAVVNGTHEADWHDVSELSAQHSWVKPSFGLHPWHVGNRTDHWLATLEDFLRRHPHAFIGEIGLDRWMTERALPDDTRLLGLRRASIPEQTDILCQQLALAYQQNRPASLHCIDAWDALAITLRHTPLPARGFLLHAYAGPPAMIGKFADLGAYFSFNGNFLDERKARQRAAFLAVPPERLLVETDAPAMPLPQSWRTYKLPPAADGSPVNHPGNIEAAYAGLAATLGQPIEQLATTVAANFHRLFGE